MKSLPVFGFRVNPACLPVFLLVSLGEVLADDWPVFRGPNRTGIATETGLKLDAPLSEAWKQNVGLGYGAPVVGGGMVVVSGHDGSDTDSIYCFDESTGSQKWVYSYPQPLGDLYFQGGTTGAPTINGGHVFYVAREGDFFCLDGSGAVVWKTHLQKDLGCKKPDWGFTGAPLVIGDRVYVNAGDSGVAFDKFTGSVVWKSGGGESGYSTPYHFNKGGEDLLIFSNKRFYVCVDAQSGDKLWEVKWMTRYGVNASDPIVDGDYIFISTGYGKGATLLKWDGSGDPQEIWKSRDMKNQMNASILVDGYLYGIDGDEGKNDTVLKCLEMVSGKTIWSDGSVGHGAVSVADGKLIVITEEGELQVAPVSTEGYKPVVKQKVLPSRVWTAPVIANGRIYCRDQSGNLVALSAG